MDKRFQKIEKAFKKLTGVDIKGKALLLENPKKTKLWFFRN